MSDNNVSLKTPNCLLMIGNIMSRFKGLHMLEITHNKSVIPLNFYELKKKTKKKTDTQFIGLCIWIPQLQFTQRSIEGVKWKASKEPVDEQKAWIRCISWPSFFFYFFLFCGGQLNQLNCCSASINSDSFGACEYVDGLRSLFSRVVFFFFSTSTPPGQWREEVGIINRVTNYF